MPALQVARLGPAVKLVPSPGAKVLTESQLERFRLSGHITVPHLFKPETIEDARQEVEVWSQQFLAEMTDAQKQWYLEKAGTCGAVLRKLDEPVFHREVFRRMASEPALVQIVEQIIGPGVSVFFSQVFCKPPELGGPKPVHQDNFYFGPSDRDATLTVWIALDDATLENGCLYYADGSQHASIYKHVAPEGEPFNLQIPSEFLDDFSMSPAPVPAGGVSFHHGNTWHQSSANTSSKPRRAVAMHFLRNDAELIAPALRYDPQVVVKIT